MKYQDILYEKNNGIAKITINRPQVLNAFRSITINEMIEAFGEAWDDNSIGVVVLTGAGDRSFCVGGDQKAKDENGGYGGHTGREWGNGLRITELHALIRDIPKPVIAAVNGYAIGGGHVFHVLCDLTIASERAVFGQAGPKVGSFDAGFGSVYLARLVGEKKAREIWYLCRKYSAKEALDMGLVNKIVPHEELMKEVDAWCKEILEKSPFALKMLKASFNADTEHVKGIESMAQGSLGLFYKTDEAREGGKAFLEKRSPDFKKFRK